MLKVSVKGKKNFINETKDILVSNIYVDTFFDYIEESKNNDPKSTDFEISGRYTKSGRPYLYKYSEYDFELMPFEQACCYDCTDRFQRKIWDNTEGRDFDMLIKSLKSEYEENGGDYEKALDTVIGKEEEEGRG